MHKTNFCITCLLSHSLTWPNFTYFLKYWCSVWLQISIHPRIPEQLFSLLSSYSFQVSNLLSMVQSFLYRTHLINFTHATLYLMLFAVWRYFATEQRTQNWWGNFSVSCPTLKMWFLSRLWFWWHSVGSTKECKLVLLCSSVKFHRSSCFLFTAIQLSWSCRKSFLVLK